ncbi:alpha/beta hydrolase [Actinomycetospora sp. CA-084318]|uniref:alpha/beta hydrolase n=1 Tax=Actinomycetospora sp. CA-084318 TaxID=3239892 RepID=UPI003D98FCA7
MTRARRGVLRRVLVVAGAIVALVALLVGGLWLGQRHLIYLPDTGPVPAAASVLPGAEDVVLRTADGEALGAWFVPARGPRRDVTVLVFNGNAGDRSLRAPLAAALRAQGVDVLLLDYRGYGDSSGSPSEEGLAADARAAHEYLVTTRSVPPQRLILLGESLGGAVAARLAVEAPVAGMVLRSPFTELAAIAERLYPVLPVRLLLADRFPVAELVSRAGVPTTVVLGEDDRLIPPAQSRAVAAAARAEVVAVPGADHNDAVLGHGPAVVSAVTRLADSLSGPAR